MGITIFDAVKRGKAGRIVTLLEQGADPNSRDVELANAAGQAEVENSDGWCYDSVFYAFKGGHRYGDTPLMYCAKRGKLDHARALVDGGAELSTTNSIGLTALHYAAFEKHESFALWLLDAGADPIAGQAGALSPLLGATMHEDGCLTELCIRLLRSGVSPNCAFEHSTVVGKTPLMNVGFNGTPELFRALLESGANPMAQSDIGETAARWVIANHVVDAEGRLRMLLDWLKAGGDPAFVEEEGHTLVHDAAIGDVSVLRALVDLGIACDRQTDNGCTPLMFAAQSDRIENVQLLLAHGANPNATTMDSMPQSVLDRARAFARPELVTLLIEAGAKPASEIDQA
ncbi:MAG: ankyrin repeat domain-containing protein [Planctomycetota bacterium]